MSLYSEWSENLKNINTEEDYNNFINDYFKKETEIYRSILESKNPVFNGKINELAQKYNISNKEMVGFLEGANTSFNEPLSLEDINEESDINAEFNFEKLLWNMHESKAEWLYNLNEWNNIFDDEKRKTIKKDFNRSKIVRNEEKIGRNDPCICGSGKKYKKCCGANK